MALNILLVDDSGIMRKMIARVINMSGAPVGEIIEADNGRAGLDALGNNWIDLVFTDLNMPVMDGAEMIERMRDDDVMREIPIIVVSTEGSDTKINKLLSIKGVRGFIRKPFDPGEARDVIFKAIGIDTEATENVSTDPL